MAPARDFLIALQFLTRLPVRTATSWTMADLAASAPMFPLIGALVGFIGALVYATASFLGLPPALAGVLAIAAAILSTGALHEDGLADVADVFGGGHSKDDKLRIMRDSRLGSYGAIALALCLFARIACLSTLAAPFAVGAALIASNALSRAAMPVAMTVMPNARDDGLAASAGRPHPGRAAAGLLVALLSTALCLPLPIAIAATVVTGIASVMLLALAQRQIGGITGDVLGALQQIVEISCLLAVVAATR